MYVDETGNADLRHTDDQNHRFLSLTGVVVDLDDDVNMIAPEMAAFKASFFGFRPDSPVILHRSEMMNRRGDFRIFRDRGLRERFDEELLRLMRRWDYAVITVCVDKKNYVRKFGRRDSPLEDPYHYCMEILLETFCDLLEGQGGRGDVLAESRGGREDERLKDEFGRLWETGSENLSATRIQSSITSRELKVSRKSDDVAGLQLADMIANPSRSEILAERGLLGRDLGAFAKSLRGVLMPKYYQRDSEMRGRQLI